MSVKARNVLGGKLVFNIFAALAEFERRVIPCAHHGRPAGSPGPWQPRRQASCPQRGQRPGRRQGPAARSRIHRARGRQAPGRSGSDPLPPSAGAHRGPGSGGLHYFYPIDWPQISHWVRFVHAQGHCQLCGRPHSAIVRHLGDGRWWDEAQQTLAGRQRSQGPPAPTPDVPLRTTKVVLAAAHLDHARPLWAAAPATVEALCQRCHLLYRGV